MFNNVTSDWLLPHCSKLPCTHFLRELSTLPETDENEERGKTELVEIQESCEQFSGRSSSPTVSVQNWSLRLWNKPVNQISVNRGLSYSQRKIIYILKFLFKTFINFKFPSSKTLTLSKVWMYIKVLDDKNSVSNLPFFPFTVWWQKWQIIFKLGSLLGMVIKALSAKKAGMAAWC